MKSILRGAIVLSLLCFGLSGITAAETVSAQADSW